MESQPQNPEFRNNTENFHPCKLSVCKQQRFAGLSDHFLMDNAMSPKNLLGLRKPVFGVSEEVRLKSICVATETS